MPDPLRAKPSQVAVNETAVKINADYHWTYDTIHLDSRVILDVVVFGRKGTDTAAAFLHQLSERYDLPETVFLVDGYDYRTSLSRLELFGQIDYVERNLIEKWFHTVTV